MDLSVQTVMMMVIKYIGIRIMQVLTRVLTQALIKVTAVWRIILDIMVLHQLNVNYDVHFDVDYDYENDDDDLH